MRCIQYKHKVEIKGERDGKVRDDKGEKNERYRE